MFGPTRVCVFGPTRVTAFTATKSDYVLSSRAENSIWAHAIDTGISDHRFAFFTSKYETLVQKPKLIRRRFCK